MLTIFNPVDNLLNSITMYRLVLYGLFILAGISIILGFAGLLPYSGISLVVSFLVATVTCYTTNFILEFIFKAPSNTESSSITALILFFLMWPVSGINELISLTLACVLAMASKYFLAIGHRHIFNPAAIGAAILVIFGSGNVIWWVGSLYLFPATLIFGLLVVRKIRRFNLFFSFFITAMAFLILNAWIKNLDIMNVIIQTLISGPIIFFGTIMLTEPQTTPPGRPLQILYGALTGILFSSQIQFGRFLMTPEIALVLSNIFAYFFGSKEKLILTLKAKANLSPSIYEFIFSSNIPMAFTAGQYMEWTLGNFKADSRGNRRYFTIASSPTETDFKIGIKMAPVPSAFKKALVNLKTGDKMVSSQLSGDFVLPKKQDEKLVFIAGGIGVTPFRSMIKDLIDTNTKKDIVLFYTNLDASDFVYKDIFTKAQNLGLKTIYVLSDPAKAPKDWTGKTGYITEDMVKTEVPDYKNRQYYLSGPIAMVNSYKKLLEKLGIPMTRITTDYFPGF